MLYVIQVTTKDKFKTYIVNLKHHPFLARVTTIKNECAFNTIEDCVTILNSQITHLFSNSFEVLMFSTIIERCSTFVKVEILDYESKNIIIDCTDIVFDIFFKYLNDYIKDKSTDEDHIAYGLVNKDDSIYWHIVSKDKVNFKRIYPTYLYYGKCKDKNNLMIFSLKYGFRKFHEITTAKEIREQLGNFNKKFLEIY